MCVVCTNPLFFSSKFESSYRSAAAAAAAAVQQKENVGGTYTVQSH